ncbi:MAG: hypothetical protein [Escherichia phage RP3]|uniref:Uncharacterized protein n=1 Tax=Escherichia phage RP3 TaxID=2867296 RepID=A0ABY3THS1_9CAUD|nr:MAG: hypothetical protein [Escherichia phage RP3]
MQVGGCRWGCRHFSQGYHIRKEKSTEKFVAD